MALTNFLKVVNNAVSELQATLAQGATTMNVVDISAMPSSFPFRLTIWDAAVYGWTNPADDPNMEIIEVTGFGSSYYYPDGGGYAYAPDADEYAIIRAREATVDVEHGSGSVVALLITAGMWDQVIGAINALETP